MNQKKNDEVVPVDNTSSVAAFEKEKQAKIEQTENQNWEIPAAHHVAHDPLLGCLVILTRLEHNPFAPDTLIAGLPLLNNKLTPELFVRAAGRANLAAQIVKRPFEDISKLVLPCVLLMKKRHACILIEKNDEAKVVNVIHPESGKGEIQRSFYAIMD